MALEQGDTGDMSTALMGKGGKDVYLYLLLTTATHVSRMSSSEPYSEGSLDGTSV